MKMDTHILGFEQKKLLEVTGIREKVKKINGEKKVISEKIRLDISDLVILQKIAKFCGSSGTYVNFEKGVPYYCITYDIILSNLPFLGITKQALADRINKYVILGLINFEVVTTQTNPLSGNKVKGKFTAFQLTEKFNSLLAENTAGTYIDKNVELDPKKEGGIVVNYERVSYSTTKGSRSQLRIKEQVKETLKKNMNHELDSFEKLFKKFGINFTKTNQESVKKLLAKMKVDEVINYLEETYENLKNTPSINSVAGTFTKKIATGERQAPFKTIPNEKSIETIGDEKEIDYRAFNKKQKISFIEKTMNDIEKTELKTKIKSSLTEENDFLDLEALEKIVLEDYEYVLIKRFNNKYLGGER